MTAPGPSADRNLLFGILALRMDFITRDALVQAMHAWVLEKSRPLGEILLEQKHLSADQHNLLDALVQEHLKQHNHDPQQSLAAVSSIKSIREDLEKLADPDIAATLAFVSIARDPNSAQVSDLADTIPRSARVSDPADTISSATTPSGHRFVILRPHAKGGLGQVSVARDQELNREVASTARRWWSTGAWPKSPAAPTPRPSATKPLCNPPPATARLARCSAVRSARLAT